MQAVQREMIPASNVDATWRKLMDLQPGVPVQVSSCEYVIHICLSRVIHMPVPLGLYVA